METPKSRNQRRTKGLSRKRRNLSIRGVPDPQVLSIHEAGVSQESIPLQTVHKNAKIVESEQEEIRGVEWEFKNLVEADAPVVWGSPQGSPVINTVRSLESPVSKTRNIGHTPKQLSYTESDPPEFLNDIVALYESFQTREGSEANAKDSVDGVSKVDDNLNDSYSNLFDESMNEYLIQCSQELENNSKSIDKTVKVNSDLHESESTKSVPKLIISNLSPRRKIPLSSTSNSTSPFGTFSWSARTPPRVGSKNYVDHKKKSTTYVYKGRVLGVQKSGVRNCATHIDRDVQNKVKPIGVLQPCKNVGKAAKSPKSGKSDSVTDLREFERIKDWFSDDDDLLSSIPVDLGVVDSRNTTPSRKIPVDAVEGMNHQKDSPNVNNAFDDSALFGDGVLEFLDTIESNAVPSCTPKLRCTPEEIEKKRQVAKSKLEKKKLILRNRTK